MFKKLIFFLSFSTFIILFTNQLSADDANIIPLKKPILTAKELDKKISINILKPLAKPDKKKN